MSKIIASCGHEISDVESGVAVQFDDEEVCFNGSEPYLASVTVHAVYCGKCAAEGMKAGHLRVEEADA
jgi:hypothetical protein